MSKEPRYSKMICESLHRWHHNLHEFKLFFLGNFLSLPLWSFDVMSYFYPVRLLRKFRNVLLPLTLTGGLPSGFWIQYRLHNHANWSYFRCDVSSFSCSKSAAGRFIANYDCFFPVTRAKSLKNRKLPDNGKLSKAQLLVEWIWKFPSSVSELKFCNFL